MLRDMGPQDFDAFRYWQQPHHDWHQLDGPYYPRMTGEEVDATLERVEKTRETDDWPDPRRRFMIAEPTTDRLLGMVSRYWISEETHWSALGIVIFDPANWGREIGYDALGLWTDYLFTAFPTWVRLDLRTWSGNAGMMALAQKLGYQEEARFRMARIVDGAYCDGLGYGVLRSEWTSRFPGGFAVSL